MKELIKQQIYDSIEVKKELINYGIDLIEKAGRILVDSIKSGGKICSSIRK